MLPRIIALVLANLPFMVSENGATRAMLCVKKVILLVRDRLQ